MKRTIVTCDIPGCCKFATLEGEQQMSDIIKAAIQANFGPIFAENDPEVSHCSTYDMDLCKDHHQGIHDFMRPHTDAMEARFNQLIEEYKNDQGDESLNNVVPLH